jgi:hypothetical protein
LLPGKEPVFPRFVSGWDHPLMSEKKDEDASESSRDRQAEHGQSWRVADYPADAHCGEAPA